MKLTAKSAPIVQGIAQSIVDGAFYLAREVLTDIHQNLPQRLNQLARFREEQRRLEEERRISAIWEPYRLQCEMLGAFSSAVTGGKTAEQGASEDCTTSLNQLSPALKLSGELPAHVQEEEKIVVGKQYTQQSLSELYVCQKSGYREAYILVLRHAATGKNGKAKILSVKQQLLLKSRFRKRWKRFVAEDRIVIKLSNDTFDWHYKP